MPILYGKTAKHINTLSAGGVLVLVCRTLFYRLLVFPYEKCCIRFFPYWMFCFIFEFELLKKFISRDFLN